jgi:hypothetical protein
MKTALILVLGGTLLIALFVRFATNKPGLIPHHESASYSLMPGHGVRIQNENSIEISVLSDYPVSISGAGCRVDRTVQEVLSCGPYEIDIQDMRPAVLIWGRANHVQWTITY